VAIRPHGLFELHLVRAWRARVAAPFDLRHDVMNIDAEFMAEAAPKMRHAPNRELCPF
jgi:hypothetical protein